jgi:hypothetical protein
MLWLTASGCLSAVHVENIKPPTAGDFPRTVAVLPFTFDRNIPVDERPHRLLRRTFFNHFSYLGYGDQPLRETDQRVAKTGFSRLAPHVPLNIGELRRALGVDAVVRGHVLEANNFTGGIYAETRIKAALEMVDLRTGEILWKTEHQELTSSGITNLTVLELVQDEIDNSHVAEAYRKVAETFVLKVMEQLPDPAEFLRAEVKAPKIASFQANVPPSRTLRPYETIWASLEGEPGLTASFDLGGWKAGVPMQELTPGSYVGHYQIKPGDPLASTLVIGRLQNKEGVATRRIYRGVPAENNKTPQTSFGLLEKASRVQPPSATF